MDNQYFLIATAQAEGASLVELRLSSTAVGEGASFRLLPGSRHDVVRRLADLVRSLVTSGGFSRR
ncbi:hypothetical protein ACFODL_07030 [Phenylobacterium terrae]|uniref:YicC-like N-terminal domain-containing protein n=1 Tax=Phenylobacterium terrae TaxID=2665495 RepID=A0ABW4N6A5_9CAUL